MRKRKRKKKRKRKRKRKRKLPIVSSLQSPTNEDLRRSLPKSFSDVFDG
jgi:hypothetical protein